MTQNLNLGIVFIALAVIFLGLALRDYLIIREQTHAGQKNMVTDRVYFRRCGDFSLCVTAF